MELHHQVFRGLGARIVDPVRFGRWCVLQVRHQGTARRIRQQAARLASRPEDGVVDQAGGGEAHRDGKQGRGFDPGDRESADYRACAAYSPLYG